MQWESMGFKGNPLSTDPIKQATLPLYVGHSQEMLACQNVLSDRNVNLVVEGARGVGTTSFANCLRFHLQEKKRYFTPQNEIRVEKGWMLETLLAVIVANIVREVELFHAEATLSDKRFQNAKALSVRIAEAYRSFGVEAFGVGINYGKSAGITSQPLIVPSAVLGHHLEDLAQLIQEIGYQHGILIQLNNLDIGAIHDEDHMRYLFNALRDYLQTDGISWILVGDVGLRGFIAQEVDRLDDIISYEVKIEPLAEKDFIVLINKRIDYYRNNPKAEFPIDQSVFLYLFKLTKGRLRYIFGLSIRLMSSLYIGDLMDKVTLDIAKPMLAKLAKERIGRVSLTPLEETILKLIVKEGTIYSNVLTTKIDKAASFISKTVSNLIKMKLIMSEVSGRNKIYSPSLDATIAYSEEEQSVKAKK
jgi:hypothetical protein